MANIHTAYPELRPVMEIVKGERLVQEREDTTFSMNDRLLRAKLYCKISNAGANA